MAVVTMRRLLREPGAVFGNLEETREPVLLTRDGKPVAALLPVDPDHMTQVALAALPEFVESREKAERAREEGRIASAADAIQDFAARHGRSSLDAAASDVPPSADDAGVIGQMRALFGDDVAVEFADGVERRVSAVSNILVEPVQARAAVASGKEPSGELDEEIAVEKFRQLNSQLFARMFRRALQERLGQVLSGSTLVDAATADIESGTGGLLGKRVVEQALDTVTERVASFNRRFVEGLPAEAVSVTTYKLIVDSTDLLGLSKDEAADLRLPGVRIQAEQ